MLAIFGTLAFKKWLLNDGSEIPVRIDVQDIYNVVITTLIFIIFVFLPYGLTKCLYWWCYEGKNVSERWIKPSFIISVVTVVLYIFVGISAFV